MSFVPLDLPVLAFLCLMTFLAGLVDSIAGGGGLISLPAFMLTGIPTSTALACNKLSSSAGTTISTARYLRAGVVNLPIAIVTAIAAMAGSALSTNLMIRIPENVLHIVVLLLLPLAAVAALGKRRGRKEDCRQHEPAVTADAETGGTQGDGREQDAKRKKSLPDMRTFLISLPIGFLIGMYDGLVGPATGTFLIIAFTAILGFGTVEAGGIGKVVNLCSNYASLTILLAAGKVAFGIAVPAAIFCCLGHFIGAGIALRDGEKVIRPLMLVVICLLGVTLLAQLAIP